MFWSLQQVRLQDAGLSLASLATSALGSKLVWTAFRERYVELHDRFSDTGRCRCRFGASLVGCWNMCSKRALWTHDERCGERDRESAGGIDRQTENDTGMQRSALMNATLV